MLLTRTADPVDHRDAAYDETKLRYALNTPVYLPTPCTRLHLGAHLVCS